MLAEDKRFAAHFISRVYCTALVVWCVGSALSAIMGVTIITSFAAGGLLSVLFLVAQERMAKAVIGMPSFRQVRRLVRLSLLKYLGVCVAVWLLLRHQMMNPFAFCAGILLVPAAMCFQWGMMVVRASVAERR